MVRISKIKRNIDITKGYGDRFAISLYEGGRHFELYDGNTFIGGSREELIELRDLIDKVIEATDEENQKS